MSQTKPLETWIQSRWANQMKQCQRPSRNKPANKVSEWRDHRQEKCCNSKDSLTKLSRRISRSCKSKLNRAKPMMSRTRQMANWSFWLMATSKKWRLLCKMCKRRIRTAWPTCPCRRSWRSNRLAELPKRAAKVNLCSARSADNWAVRSAR